MKKNIKPIFINILGLMIFIFSFPALSIDLQSFEAQKIEQCNKAKEPVFLEKQAEKSDFLEPYVAYSPLIIHSPEASIVSEEEIQIIFQILASKKHIPFDKAKEGCAARALEMALIMDDMCLKSIKAFMMGPVSAKNYYWDEYHTAPILYVETAQGSIVPYIIDPSIYDKAVPLKIWAYGLTRNSRSFHSLSITKRFIYHIDDRNLNLTHYRSMDKAKKNAQLPLSKLFFDFL